MARKSDYTEELALKICSQIANGKSLKKIGEQDDMPTRATIHNWLLDENKYITNDKGEKVKFFDKYEEAVNIRTENMFDELNEISDIKDELESPSRSRLRVDTRKWYLSKVMPKKYGDKLDLTTDGKELPTPILPINVLPNPGNNENSEANKED